MRYQSIETLLETTIVGLGFDLLGVELLRQDGNRILRVYIDKLHGINVDDCGVVSRQISDVLDLDDPIEGQYDLEVSSPGIERPLFKPEHYQQFIGETIKIRLNRSINGRRHFKSATIKAVNPQQLLLRCDDQDIPIDWTNIDNANLSPQFNIGKSK